MTETVEPELEELADAHGVATWYEDAQQRRTDIDRSVVVAVLRQLDVDAGGPAAIRSEIAAVRARPALPDTVVVRQGSRREVGRGVVRAEDGTRHDVDGVLPPDLPVGWHTLETGDREIPIAVTPARMPPVPRAWGWMLQLYALHSAGSWGIGDFGDLSAFLRGAAAEGTGVALVSPVGAITPVPPVQRSPYSPSSRRFVNPIHLRITDVEAFRRAGPQVREQVAALSPGRPGGLIDHDGVWSAKRQALELLWSARQEPVAGPDTLDPALRDFATFCALAERHGPDWRRWPQQLRRPDGAAAAAARHELAERVAFHAWLQELCDDQLAAARAAASGMAVGVVHDLPVGVDPGGADAWALQDVLAARVRVGAPPDAFSMQGQDWDLPPWRPDRLAATGYRAWRDVLGSVLRHGDGIRVDHVAGLWRLWWIPPGESPDRGTYVRYDSEAMVGMLALEAHRAGAVVVGEDLGTVSPEVTETLHERGMLGSSVLYFQRDYTVEGHPFVPPQKWEPRSMASVSTHDLPTAVGFLRAEHVGVRAELGLLDDPDQERQRVAQERGELVDMLVEHGVLTSQDADEDTVLVAMHTLLATTPSALLLTSPQDALGEVRQPNLPGTVDEYPNWRIPLPVTLEELLSQPRVRAVMGALRGR